MGKWGYDLDPQICKEGSWIVQMSLLRGVPYTKTRNVSLVYVQSGKVFVEMPEDLWYNGAILMNNWCG